MSNFNGIIVAVDPQYMETLVMIKTPNEIFQYVIDDYDWESQLVKIISNFTISCQTIVFTDEKIKKLFSNFHQQLSSEIISLDRRSAELGYYFSKIPQNDIQENEKIIHLEVGRGSTTGYSYQFDDFKFRIRQKIIIPNTGLSGQISRNDLNGLIFQLTRKTNYQKMILIYEKDTFFLQNEMKIDFSEFRTMETFEYSPFDTCHGCILYAMTIMGILEKLNFNFDHELHHISIPQLQQIINKEEMPNYRLPKPIYLYESQPSVMGIDLGTTRCSVAVSRNKAIEVLQYIQGDRSFPSVICFEEDPPIVGNLAARRLRNNSKSVVYDNKRIIGKDLVMIEKNPLWPFKLVDNSNGVKIEVFTKFGLKRFSPEEIAAILLAEMKRMASDFQADYNCHQPIKKAVITVPSFFNARQREATMKAANMAGIEVMALLDEPVAGALYFMADKRISYSENDQKIEYLLVFDLGGGTLDISILENNNGNLKEISRCGDLYLGGRDFDAILVNHFRLILMAKFGIDPMQNEKKSYKLLTMVETIKKDLSAVKETNFDPTEFINEAEDIIKITREDFEEFSSSLLMRIKAKIVEGLYEAKKTANEINQIVYIGGSSKMPMIKDALLSMFPQSNHYLGADSECATATGAMIHALQLLQ